jgi:hypothetical protein
MNTHVFGSNGIGSTYSLGAPAIQGTPRHVLITAVFVSVGAAIGALVGGSKHRMRGAVIGGVVGALPPIWLAGAAGAL